jgi:hypothetical protein
VKTTLEIPDPLLRKAKATAAAEGRPLREFITEAIEQKLGASSHAGKQALWLKLAGTFGKNPEMIRESRRIQKIIDKEFSRIDPEDWK